MRRIVTNCREFRPILLSRQFWTEKLALFDQDIEYHGSAVQFGLPPRLSARYNTPEAWVLCLRAYLDGGPSDRPADWNW